MIGKPPKAEALAVKFAPDDAGAVDHGPTEDEPFLDVEAIQRKINRFIKKYGSLRVHEAIFRTPWPLTKSQYEQYRKSSVEKWLKVMESRGFRLKSKVHVRGPFSTYGLSGEWYNIPMLDSKEFRVCAAFSTNAKPIRQILPIKKIKSAAGR